MAVDRARFSETIHAYGLTLDSDQLDRFEAFEAALYDANKVMNLTRVPMEEAWSRHFVDSLLFQDLIPDCSCVLDIGTGPGFPGWPLACARPDLTVTALDSNGKMLGFLRGQALPNLKVVQVRAEEWGVRERFDVVTGRAVAPLAAQLEISAPCARVGGVVLAMRTPGDAETIGSLSPKALGLNLLEVLPRELPGHSGSRLGVLYEKVGETPAKYPRPWAEMKRKPLA